MAAHFPIRVKRPKQYLDGCLLKGALALAISLLLFSGAWAQPYSQDSVYLKGRVIDAKGKAIPNVTFTVGGKFEFSSDSAGSYRVAMPVKKPGASGYKYGETVTLFLKDKAKGVMVIPQYCGECQLPPDASLVDARSQPIKLVPQGHPEVENLKLAPCMALSMNRKVDAIKSFNKNVPKSMRTEPDLDLIRQQVVGEFSEEYGLPMDKLEEMLDDWSSQQNGQLQREEQKLQDQFLKDYEDKRLLPNGTPDSFEVKTQDREF